MKTFEICIPIDACVHVKVQAETCQEAVEIAKDKAELLEEMDLETSNIKFASGETLEQAEFGSIQALLDRVKAVNEDGREAEEV